MSILRGILDAEDCEVIAVGIIVVLVVGVLLVLLGAFGGIAVAVFDEMRWA